MNEASSSSDVYDGDVVYSPGGMNGSWFSTLRRNRVTLANHRGYTRFGGRIWLWYEAKSWARAKRNRETMEAKSMKGIRL